MAQVAEVDQRRSVRVGGGEFDPAVRERLLQRDVEPQVTGRGIEAQRRRAMLAVEEQRVDLHVILQGRPGRRADQAGLYRHHLILVLDRVDAIHQRHRRMVAQVAADARQVAHHVNAVLAQAAAGADPG